MSFARDFSHELKQVNSDVYNIIEHNFGFRPGEIVLISGIIMYSPSIDREKIMNIIQQLSDDPLETNDWRPRIYQLYSFIKSEKLPTDLIAYNNYTDAINYLLRLAFQTFPEYSKEEDEKIGDKIKTFIRPRYIHKRLIKKSIIDNELRKNLNMWYGNF